jgi:hypothetical protein
MPKALLAAEGPRCPEALVELEETVVFLGFSKRSCNFFTLVPEPDEDFPGVHIDVAH